MKFTKKYEPTMKPIALSTWEAFSLNPLLPKKTFICFSQPMGLKA